MPFGQVIERVVSNEIDLDTGSLNPEGLKGHRVDALYEDPVFVFSASTPLIRLTADDWDGMSPAHLKAALEEGGRALDSDFNRNTTKLPMTLGFRTGRDRMGILQILGFTENPKGVEIRYKLMQDDPVPRGDPRLKKALQELLLMVPEPSPDKARVEGAVTVRFSPVVDSMLCEWGLLDIPGGVKNTGDTIHFASGRRGKAPAEVIHAKPAEVLAWARENQVDARAELVGFPQGLVGFDLAARRLQRAQWEQMTAAQALQAAEQLESADATSMTADMAELPATFLFKTRDGTVGLLQITAMGRPKDVVGFQYKLIELDKNAAGGAGGHATPAENWGEAIEGVQARLRADKTTWKIDEVPAFMADARSQGDHELLLATMEGLGCELYFDGVKYRHSPEDFTGLAYGCIRARGQRLDGIRIGLDKEWATVEGEKPLTLTSGKHTVRFAWAGYFPTSDGSRVPDETHPVLLISNPVEIEIVEVAAPPAGQPPGSKLEFRIAPSAAALSALDQTEMGNNRNWLKGGRVGFWWKGGRIAGRIPTHAWLPVAAELSNAGRLVTGEYEGRKYVLVSDKAGQTMVPGEGRDAWGFEKVFATQDSNGQPVVGFELDDRGAERLAVFTKANLGNAMAIVVDGKVVSAPVIRSALGKHGMITGRFTEEEVRELIKALQAGMPATAPDANHAEPKQGPFKVDVELETMQNVVSQFLQQKYGLHVCLENLDVDQESGCVTLEDAIQRLEAAAKTHPLSRMQESRLTLARKVPGRRQTQGNGIRPDMVQLAGPGGLDRRVAGRDHQGHSFHLAKDRGNLCDPAEKRLAAPIPGHTEHPGVDRRTGRKEDPRTAARNRDDVCREQTGQGRL